MEKRIFIRNIPKISAIYFALLQCGYDYYALGKEAELVSTIESFRTVDAKCDGSFFAEVRQRTCEAYPYWPRAAALETAAFFLDPDSTRFRDFDVYRKDILSAGNMTDAERSQDFWNWVEGFPRALSCVLRGNGFHAYLRWENKWIEQQNLVWDNDLERIQRILERCATDYASPIQKVSVILNPIKCAYAADYHMDGDHFFYCSGAFKPESVLHEFLHHVVHPSVRAFKDAILQGPARYADVDESYFLLHDEDGKLNAFEEHLVRRLAKSVLAGYYPIPLRLFIRDILRDFS